MSSVISCKKRYLAFFLFEKGYESKVILFENEFFGNA